MGTRLVYLNCYAPGAALAAVLPHGAQGARDSLAYLHALGHRLAADEFAAIEALVGEVPRQHKPTAIMAGNNKTAACTIPCLHKRQIAVLAHVSALGLDDHPVQGPCHRSAQRAVDLACAEGPDSTVRVGCEVRERALVAAPLVSRKSREIDRWPASLLVQARCAVDAASIPSDANMKTTSSSLLPRSSALLLERSSCRCSRTG